jgi:uncharacterized glyoxalase superfamily protein PhnB
MKTVEQANQVRAVDERGEPVKLGEFNGMEIYPMPMFATLAVADVSAITNWYVEALGFAVVFQAPAIDGQPSVVHLRRKKYQDVLLVPRAASPTEAPTSMTVSFQTDDVDGLAAQARAAAKLGASSMEGPIDTPWNTRDLRVTDPAGHRLVFTGHNANADPEQVERMRKWLNSQKR